MYNPALVELLQEAPVPVFLDLAAAVRPDLAKHHIQLQLQRQLRLQPLLQVGLAATDIRRAKLHHHSISSTAGAHLRTPAHLHHMAGVLLHTEARALEQLQLMVDRRRRTRLRVLLHRLVTVDTGAAEVAAITMVSCLLPGHLVVGMEAVVPEVDMAAGLRGRDMAATLLPLPLPLSLPLPLPQRQWSNHIHPLHLHLHAMHLSGPLSTCRTLFPHQQQPSHDGPKDPQAGRRRP